MFGVAQCSRVYHLYLTTLIASVVLSLMPTTITSPIPIIASRTDWV